MERMNEQQLMNAGYESFKIAGLRPEWIGHVRKMIFWGSKETLRKNRGEEHRYVWIHREAPANILNGWHNYRVSFEPVNKWQAVEIANL